MLKLKLQYFVYLMRRVDSLEKTLLLGGIGDRRRRGRPTLLIPWTVVRQAPLSMGFSKQQYRSGLPFPSPGDLSNPGIEPRSLALQADSSLTELSRKSKNKYIR